MNLVAKEYVACQKDAAGVLVLSEFAGAAAEMGEAVIVNPYDEERTAAAVERALALPPEHRRERMAALHRRVARNNAFAWAERFTDSLRRAARSRLHAGSSEPARLPLAEATAAFHACRNGVLLLAYDGTLVPLAPRPAEASPPPELVSLLLHLGAEGRHRVAIVSGRSRVDFERWFGDVEGLWLAAEHGAVLRPPTSHEWSAIRPSPPEDWKEHVLPVLEHYVDRTPGSFIEAKEYSLVWHYRMSDPEFSEWLSNELVASLEELLAETELRAIRAHKSVEVKFAWANKGEIVRHLEAAGPAPDFRLAVGDDQTDEDLFAVMPPEAWTIRVGGGPSQARFQLGSPGDVRRMLEAMASTS
jgi:trehalose 6-phosphate synthase/phosphatase